MASLIPSTSRITNTLASDRPIAKSFRYLAVTSSLMLLVLACTVNSPTATSKDRDGLDAPAVAMGLPDVASVAERVTPSVVLVRARLERRDRFGRIREGPSRGSGVIFDNAGYILTNNHVVEGAISVDIVLSTGEEVDIEVVGTDPTTDLEGLGSDLAYLTYGLAGYGLDIAVVKSEGTRCTIE